jgi:hypothetical protein
VRVYSPGIEVRAMSNNNTGVLSTLLCLCHNRVMVRYATPNISCEGLSHNRVMVRYATPNVSALAITELWYATLPRARQRGVRGLLRYPHISCEGLCHNRVMVRYATPSASARGEGFTSLPSHEM